MARNNWKAVDGFLVIRLGKAITYLAIESRVAPFGKDNCRTLYRIAFRLNDSERTQLVDDMAEGMILFDALSTAR